MMSDGYTNYKRAEQRIHKSVAKLEKAVQQYEKDTGFEAIHYRRLPSNASLAHRINAARNDLSLYRHHTKSICANFDKAIGDI